MSTGIVGAHRTAAVLWAAYAVIGATLGALGIAVLLMSIRTAFPRVVRTMQDGLLLLALPGCGFGWIVLRHGPAMGGAGARLWPHWLLPFCLLPLAALPVLRRIATLPAGQGRAARGLGASGLQTLRHVWLPQLLPPLLAGAAVAVTLVAVAG